LGKRWGRRKDEEKKKSEKEIEKKEKKETKTKARRDLRGRDRTCSPCASVFCGLVGERPPAAWCAKSTTIHPISKHDIISR
jgi:hypothetical protein